MDTKERKRPSSPARNSSRRPAPSKRPSAGKRSVKKPVPAKKTVSREKQQYREPTPDVVYTEPGLFNRNRMILRIATVAAVVLALIFGVSIFFKVDTVTVAGNQKYTEAEIREASGIRDGDNLFGLNNAKISSNIMSRLPYVGSVRIGIKLPGTVKIEIVELAVVYSVEADDGSWWLLRSDGTVVERTNSADAGLHTMIVGVKITNPVVGEKAVAAKSEDESITVLPEEQLNTAVSLAQYLEENNIIGGAATINVTNMFALQIWYGERFQVELGDATDLQTKVSNMRKAINSMSDTETGILNVASPNSAGEFSCIPFPA